MLHGQATPRLFSPDPKAARIAALSEEYLSAPEGRQQEIGEEIRGLIDDKVVPFQRQTPLQ